MTTATRTRKTVNYRVGTYAIRANVSYLYESRTGGVGGHTMHVFENVEAKSGEEQAVLAVWNDIRERCLSDDPAHYRWINAVLEFVPEGEALGSFRTVTVSRCGKEYHAHR